MEHRMVEYLRVPRTALKVPQETPLAKPAKASVSERILEAVGNRPIAIISVSIGLGVILGCLIKRR